MKVLFSILVLFFTIDVNAQQLAKVDTFKVPELQSKVNDYANIFTKQEIEQLSEISASLEDSIGSQLAILTINSLNGHSIEDYSLHVANNWAIGREGYNDGILITLSMIDRKVRIEVGYGLEAIVKDEIAKQIIETIMSPRFKKEEFFVGVKNACLEIVNLIYNNPQLIGEQ